MLAAVVQGELLALRPFTTGNGLVARAMFRALVVGRGLDPTGVAVPEVGLLAGGPASYVGMAAAYRERDRRRAGGLARCGARRPSRSARAKAVWSRTPSRPVGSGR